MKAILYPYSVISNVVLLWKRFRYREKLFKDSRQLLLSEAARELLGDGHDIGEAPCVAHSAPLAACTFREFKYWTFLKRFETGAFLEHSWSDLDSRLFSSFSCPWHPSALTRTVSRKTTPTDRGCMMLHDWSEVVTSCDATSQHHSHPSHPWIIGPVPCESLKDEARRWPDHFPKTSKDICDVGACRPEWVCSGSWPLSFPFPKCGHTDKFLR